MYPVITISREFGSGGHSIGKKVAETLGIPFLDGEIIEEVARVSGFAEELIEDKGEFVSLRDRYFNGNFYANMYLETPQDAMYRIQKKIIIDHAKEGPCVIVGRCSDYILDKEGIPAMNVFIHANVEARKARILERYGETEVPIEKRLAKKDKGRKAYYRFYTERQWGDYENYHINLDSSYLGEDACVEIICNAAKAHDK